MGFAALYPSYACHAVVMGFASLRPPNACHATVMGFAALRPPNACHTVVMGFAALYPSYACHYACHVVGWVERSETHHPTARRLPEQVPEFAVIRIAPTVL